MCSSILQLCSLVRGESALESALLLVRCLGLNWPESSPAALPGPATPARAASSPPAAAALRNSDGDYVLPSGALNATAVAELAALGARAPGGDWSFLNARSPSVYPVVYWGLLTLAEDLSGQGEQGHYIKDTGAARLGCMHSRVAARTAAVSPLAASRMCPDPPADACSHPLCLLSCAAGYVLTPSGQELVGETNEWALPPPLLPLSLEAWNRCAVVPACSCPGQAPDEASWSVAAC